MARHDSACLTIVDQYTHPVFRYQKCGNDAALDLRTSCVRVDVNKAITRLRMRVMDVLHTLAKAGAARQSQPNPFQEQLTNIEEERRLPKEQKFWLSGRPHKSLCGISISNGRCAEAHHELGFLKTDRATLNADAALPDTSPPQEHQRQ